MINITSLEQWPEYMDSAINPVLLLLDKNMKDLRGWFYTLVGRKPGLNPRAGEGR